MQTITPRALKYSQKIGWLFLRPILKFFIGYNFSVDYNLKDIEGPFIIVSNHLSYIDPPILGTVLPFGCKVYPAYFITKDSLMTVPILGIFLKFFGAFRAFRGQGLEKALEEPKKILELGASVVFFPQGRRFQDFNLSQGRPGAASLALSAGKQILPMAICGMYPFSWKNFFLRKYRVRVCVGTPFFLSEKFEQNYAFPNPEVGTQIIMHEIKKLLEQN